MIDLKTENKEKNYEANVLHGFDLISFICMRFFIPAKNALFPLFLLKVESDSLHFILSMCFVQCNFIGITCSTKRSYRIARIDAEDQGCERDR